VEKINMFYTDETRLKEFIKAFSGSLDPRLWANLIKEEFEELKAEEPGTEEHLKEYADLMYVYSGLEVVTNLNFRDLVPEKEIKTLAVMSREIEAYIENAYYNLETVTEAFKRVHISNMSKLGEDGNPILRDDGKVLKGPNYKTPDLSDLVTS